MENPLLVGVTHRMGHRESFNRWCYTQNGTWIIPYQLVLHTKWDMVNSSLVGVTHIMDIENPLSVGVTHRMGYSESFISWCCTQNGIW